MFHCDIRFIILSAWQEKSLVLFNHLVASCQQLSEKRYASFS
uniref:Uncharacterized protein n=1 Tax=Arundo donax TaxID=35708 RepID=A0A0A9HAZ1_ARUDO